MSSRPVLKSVPRGALGFGAAQIGNLYRAVSDQDAVDTLRAAADAGFTVFDTAPFYGHGLSELRLGQFLRTRPRDSFVISTKVGCYMTVPTGKLPRSVFAAALPFKPVFDYSYDGTMRSIEQSAMRLGLPTLDIVLIHDLDRRNHGVDFERQFSIAMNGAVKALHALKRSGAIGAIGVAVNEADVGMRFLKETEIDCALLAGRYTLLDQSGLDAFLPEAQARGIPVLLGSVFNSGILASGTSDDAHYNYRAPDEPTRDRVRSFETICQRYGVPLAAVAVQFAAAHPAIASVLIGASCAETIARTVTAQNWPIPADLWCEIARAKLIAPSAPLPHGDEERRPPYK